jgi:hypothetical protein
MPNPLVAGIDVLGLYETFTVTGFRAAGPVTVCCFFGSSFAINLAARVTLSSAVRGTWGRGDATGSWDPSYGELGNFIPGSPRSTVCQVVPNYDSLHVPAGFSLVGPGLAAASAGGSLSGTGVMAFRVRKTLSFGSPLSSVNMDGRGFAGGKAGSNTRYPLSVAGSRTAAGAGPFGGDAGFLDTAVPGIMTQVRACDGMAGGLFAFGAPSCSPAKASVNISAQGIPRAQLSSRLLIGSGGGAGITLVPTAAPPYRADMDGGAGGGAVLIFADTIIMPRVDALSNGQGISPAQMPALIRADGGGDVSGPVCTEERAHGATFTAGLYRKGFPTVFTSNFRYTAEVPCPARPLSSNGGRGADGQVRVVAREITLVNGTGPASLLLVPYGSSAEVLCGTMWGVPCEQTAANASLPAPPPLIRSSAAVCHGLPSWESRATTSTPVCDITTPDGTSICIPEGAIPSAGQFCLGCTTSVSKTTFATLPGTCFIDGVCYRPGDVDPLVLPTSCRLCNPAVSQTSWTTLDGWVVRTVGTDALCFNQSSLSLFLAGSRFGSGRDGALSVPVNVAMPKLNRTLALASKNMRAVVPNPHSLVLENPSFFRPGDEALIYPRVVITDGTLPGDPRSRHGPHLYARVLLVVMGVVYFHVPVLFNGEVDLVVLRVPNYSSVTMDGYLSDYIDSRNGDGGVIAFRVRTMLNLGSSASIAAGGPAGGGPGCCPAVGAANAQVPPVPAQRYFVCASPLAKNGLVRFLNDTAGAVGGSFTGHGGPGGTCPSPLRSCPGLGGSHATLSPQPADTLCAANRSTVLLGGGNGAAEEPAFFFGSGGGGGASVVIRDIDDSRSCALGGQGGHGGGVIHIFAHTINAFPSTLSASGGVPARNADGGAGHGGGGSGGTILLEFISISVISLGPIVNAGGGNAPPGGSRGGSGRVKIVCTGTVNGVPCASPAGELSLRSLVNPSTTAAKIVTSPAGASCPGRVESRGSLADTDSLCRFSFQPSAATLGLLFVDDVCLQDGAARNLPGAWCIGCNARSAAKLATDFSVVASSCFIDGLCYQDGAEHPTDSCRACHSDLSATAWSLRRSVLRVSQTTCIPIAPAISPNTATERPIFVSQPFGDGSEGVLEVGPALVTLRPNATTAFQFDASAPASYYPTAHNGSSLTARAFFVDTLSTRARRVSGGANFVVRVETLVGTPLVTSLQAQLGPAGATLTPTIAVGDEVLLYPDPRASPLSLFGAYVSRRVLLANPREGTVTFDLPVPSNYTEPFFVLRVPMYSNVTVAAGFIITARPYDDVSGFGGIVAFRASGTLRLDAGGFISGSGLGFKGGAVANRSRAYTAVDNSVAPPVAPAGSGFAAGAGAFTGGAAAAELMGKQRNITAAGALVPGQTDPLLVHPHFFAQVPRIYTAAFPRPPSATWNLSGTVIYPRGSLMQRYPEDAWVNWPVTLGYLDFGCGGGGGAGSSGVAGQPGSQLRCEGSGSGGAYPPTDIAARAPGSFGFGSGGGSGAWDTDLPRTFPVVTYDYFAVVFNNEKYRFQYSPVIYGAVSTGATSPGGDGGRGGGAVIVSASSTVVGSNTTGGPVPDTDPYGGAFDPTRLHGYISADGVCGGRAIEPSGVLYEASGITLSRLLDNTSVPAPRQQPIGGPGGGGGGGSIHFTTLRLTRRLPLGTAISGLTANSRAVLSVSGGAGGTSADACPFSNSTCLTSSAWRKGYSAATRTVGSVFTDRIVAGGSGSIGSVVASVGAYVLEVGVQGNTTTLASPALTSPGMLQAGSLAISSASSSLAPLTSASLCAPFSLVGPVCLIDNPAFGGLVCRQHGQAMSAALPCAICNTSLSTSSVSVAPGTCFIDGRCVPAGALRDSGAAPCGAAYCDPSSSPSSWTIPPSCYVAGLCYSEGDPFVDLYGLNPCLRCRSAVSTTSLTAVAGCTEPVCPGGQGKPRVGVCGCNPNPAALAPFEPFYFPGRSRPADGFCTVTPNPALPDSRSCFWAGDVDVIGSGPTSRCDTCEPSLSTTALVGVLTGQCRINNTCYLPGERSRTDPDPCFVCDPSRNQTGWSVDSACAAGRPPEFVRCPAGAGGKQLAGPCGCNLTEPSPAPPGSNPAGGVCKIVISGTLTCVYAGTPNPDPVRFCEVCNPAVNGTSWSLGVGAGAMAAGTCYLGKACRRDGEVRMVAPSPVTAPTVLKPYPCNICNSSISQVQWSLPVVGRYCAFPSPGSSGNPNPLGAIVLATSTATVNPLRGVDVAYDIVDSLVTRLIDDSYYGFFVVPGSKLSADARIQQFFSGQGPVDPLAYLCVADGERVDASSCAVCSAGDGYTAIKPAPAGVPCGDGRKCAVTNVCSGQDTSCTASFSPLAVNPADLAGASAPRIAGLAAAGLSLFDTFGAMGLQFTVVAPTGLLLTRLGLFVNNVTDAALYAAGAFEAEVFLNDVDSQAQLLSVLFSKDTPGTPSTDGMFRYLSVTTTSLKPGFKGTLAVRYSTFALPGPILSVGAPNTFDRALHCVNATGPVPAPDNLVMWGDLTYGPAGGGIASPAGIPRRVILRSLRRYCSRAAPLDSVDPLGRSTDLDGVVFRAPYDLFPQDGDAVLQMAGARFQGSVHFTGSSRNVTLPTRVGAALSSGLLGHRLTRRSDPADTTSGAAPYIPSGGGAELRGGSGRLPADRSWLVISYDLGPVNATQVSLASSVVSPSACPADIVVTMSGTVQVSVAAAPDVTTTFDAILANTSSPALLGGSILVALRVNASCNYSALSAEQVAKGVPFTGLAFTLVARGASAGEQITLAAFPGEFRPMQPRVPWAFFTTAAAPGLRGSPVTPQLLAASGSPSTFPLMGHPLASEVPPGDGSSRLDYLVPGLTLQSSPYLRRDGLGYIPASAPSAAGQAIVISYAFPNLLSLREPGSALALTLAPRGASVLTNPSVSARVIAMAGASVVYDIDCPALSTCDLAARAASTAFIRAGESYRISISPSDGVSELFFTLSLALVRAGTPNPLFASMDLAPVPACDIGGMCVLHGALSPLSDCMVCDYLRNPSGYSLLSPSLQPCQSCNSTKGCVCNLVGVCVVDPLGIAPGNISLPASPLPTAATPVIPLEPTLRPVPDLPRNAGGLPAGFSPVTNASSASASTPPAKEPAFVPNASSNASPTVRAVLPINGTNMTFTSLPEAMGAGVEAGEAFIRFQVASGIPSSPFQCSTTWTALTSTLPVFFTSTNAQNPARLDAPLTAALRVTEDLLRAAAGTGTGAAPSRRVSVSLTAAALAQPSNISVRLANRTLADAGIVCLDASLVVNPVPSLLGTLFNLASPLPLSFLADPSSPFAFIGGIRATTAIAQLRLLAGLAVNVEDAFLALSFPAATLFPASVFPGGLVSWRGLAASSRYLDRTMVATGTIAISIPLPSPVTLTNYTARVAVQMGNNGSVNVTRIYFATPAGAPITKLTLIPGVLGGFAVTSGFVDAVAREATFLGLADLSLPLFGSLGSFRAVLAVSRRASNGSVSAASAPARVSFGLAAVAPQYVTLLPGVMRLSPRSVYMDTLTGEVAVQGLVDLALPYVGRLGEYAVDLKANFSAPNFGGGKPDLSFYVRSSSADVVTLIPQFLAVRVKEVSASTVAYRLEATADIKLMLLGADLGTYAGSIDLRFNRSFPYGQNVSSYAFSFSNPTAQKWAVVPGFLDLAVYYGSFDAATGLGLVVATADVSVPLPGWGKILPDLNITMGLKYDMPSVGQLPNFTLPNVAIPNIFGSFLPTAPLRLPLIPGWAELKVNFGSFNTRVPTVSLGPVTASASASSPGSLGAGLPSFGSLGNFSSSFSFSGTVTLPFLGEINAVCNLTWPQPNFKGELSVTVDLVPSSSLTLASVLQKFGLSTDDLGGFAAPVRGLGIRRVFLDLKRQLVRIEVAGATASVNTVEVIPDLLTVGKLNLVVEVYVGGCPAGQTCTATASNTQGTQGSSSSSSFLYGPAASAAVAGGSLVTPPAKGASGASVSVSFNCDWQVGSRVGKLIVQSAGGGDWMITGLFGSVGLRDLTSIFMGGAATPSEIDPILDNLNFTDVVVRAFLSSKPNSAVKIISLSATPTGPLIDALLGPGSRIEVLGGSVTVKGFQKKVVLLGARLRVSDFFKAIAGLFSGGVSLPPIPLPTLPNSIMALRLSSVDLDLPSVPGLSFQNPDLLDGLSLSFLKGVSIPFSISLVKGPQCSTQTICVLFNGLFDLFGITVPTASISPINGFITTTSVSVGVDFTVAIPSVDLGAFSLSRDLTLSARVPFKGPGAGVLEWAFASDVTLSVGGLKGTFGVKLFASPGGQFGFRVDIPKFIPNFLGLPFIMVGQANFQGTVQRGLEGVFGGTGVIGKGCDRGLSSDMLTFRPPAGVSCTSFVAFYGSSPKAGGAPEFVYGDFPGQVSLKTLVGQILGVSLGSFPVDVVTKDLLFSWSLSGRTIQSGLRGTVNVPAGLFVSGRVLNFLGLLPEVDILLSMPLTSAMQVAINSAAGSGGDVGVALLREFANEYTASLQVEFVNPIVPKVGGVSLAGVAIYRSRAEQNLGPLVKASLSVAPAKGTFALGIKFQCNIKVAKFLDLDALVEYTSSSLLITASVNLFGFAGDVSIGTSLSPSYPGVWMSPRLKVKFVVSQTNQLTLVDSLFGALLGLLGDSLGFLKDFSSALFSFVIANAKPILQILGSTGINSLVFDAALGDAGLGYVAGVADVTVLGLRAPSLGFTFDSRDASIGGLAKSLAGAGASLLKSVASYRGAPFLARCPPGSNTLGGFGVDLICFPACKAGYKFVAGFCYETCKSGYTDVAAGCAILDTRAPVINCKRKIGSACVKADFSCPEGYRNFLIGCVKVNFYFRKVDIMFHLVFLPNDCGVGVMDPIGVYPLSCYPRCAPDQTGFGPVCLHAKFGNPVALNIISLFNPADTITKLIVPFKNGVLDEILGFANKAKDSLLDGLTAAVDGALDVLEGVCTVAKAILDVASDTLGAAYDAATALLKGDFSGAADVVAGFAKGIVTSLAEVAGKLYDITKNIASKAWSAIAGGS